MTTPFDDDFTGANGANPDSSKWRYISSSVPVLDTNRLKVNTVLGNRIEGMFTLTGDFEVIVDYDVSNHTSSASAGLDLWFRIDALHQMLIRVGYIGSFTYQRGYVNGGSWSYTSSQTATNTGKISLRREGNNLRAFIYNGTWREIGSAVAINANAGRIQLCGASWGAYPDWDGYFDNFTISSGTPVADPEIVPTIYDDNFTGVDDDPPNASKWSIISGSPVISENQLKVVTSNEAKIDGNYTLTGDFDIQVDYDITGYPSISNFGLDLIFTIDDTHAILIRVGYIGGLYYQLGVINGGSWSYSLITGVGVTGKLRLKRIGTLLEAWVYGTSGWSQHGTGSTINADAGTVSLRATQWTGNPNFTGYFDNYLILIGDVPPLSMGAPDNSTSLTTCQDIPAVCANSISLTTCEAITLDRPDDNRSFTRNSNLSLANPLAVISLTTCSGPQPKAGLFLVF